MTREEKAREISTICDKFGCTDKQRERHYTLFVEEGWQPHASQRFQRWWYKQIEYVESKEGDKPGIPAVVAQNTGRIWDAYTTAKEIGAA